MPTNDELRTWLDGLTTDTEKGLYYVEDPNTDGEYHAAFRSLLDREEALAAYIKAVDGLVKELSRIKTADSFLILTYTTLQAALSAVESARAKLGEK